MFKTANLKRIKPAIRNILIKTSDASFGRIIRLFQSHLVYRTPIDTVSDLITQNAIRSSAEYAIKNFCEAMPFASRSDLWSYCLNKENQTQLQNGGIIAEFGVWKGESINSFARQCPGARIFGFDSFEGLEENWYGYGLHKGAMSTKGKIPKVESNVKIIDGWFEDTLPKFTQELKNDQILILHMDADTYKPSNYVLNALSKNLRKGSIIIFDEYFGYTAWELHEFKAFQEIVSTFEIKYKYIGYTNMQVAVEIL